MGTQCRVKLISQKYVALIYFRLIDFGEEMMASIMLYYAMHHRIILLRDSAHT